MSDAIILAKSKHLSSHFTVHFAYANKETKQIFLYFRLPQLFIVDSLGRMHLTSQESSATALTEILNEEAQVSDKPLSRQALHSIAQLDPFAGGVESLHSHPNLESGTLFYTQSKSTRDLVSCALRDSMTTSDYCALLRQLLDARSSCLDRMLNYTL